MEKIIISFMFVGGTLLFLFGAMILGHSIMWIPTLVFFILAVFFAVHDFSNTKNTEQTKEDD